jgi:hypothetical protein
LLNDTPSARADQIARITSLQGVADRLIEIARHESLARQVQLAFRDLAEARLWLEERNVDERPAILSIAAMATGLAECRLTMVQKAVMTDGPDASVID